MAARGSRRPSRRPAISKHAARERTDEGRANLCDEITGKIIAELEAGRVPWVQPWSTAAAKAPLAMPKNASTERFYSGINVLILWGAVIERGFLGQNAEASRRRGNRAGVDGVRDESASHQRLSSWYAAANGAVPVADLRRTSFAYARWWCSAPEHQPAGRAESC
jgi:hypothetical protein